MPTNRYCIFVIPAQHRLSGNIMIGTYCGDDPSTFVEGGSFSRGANADGSYLDEENLYETATHFFGGMPVTEEWLSVVSNLASEMIAPSGGWPCCGVTEAEAITAAQAIYLQVIITQDGSIPYALTALDNAMAYLNLVPIVPIEV